VITVVPCYTSLVLNMVTPQEKRWCVVLCSLRSKRLSQFHMKPSVHLQLVQEFRAQREQMSALCVINIMNVMHKTPLLWHCSIGRGSQTVGRPPGGAVGPLYEGRIRAQVQHI
jgi:hypothetical protein